MIHAGKTPFGCTFCEKVLTNNLLPILKLVLYYDNLLIIFVIIPFTDLQIPFTVNRPWKNPHGRKTLQMPVLPKSTLTIHYLVFSIVTNILIKFY